MLRGAIVFFILGLVAFVLGANGIAGLSIDIGKILLIVFLVLSAIAFVGSILTKGRVKPMV